MPLKLGRARFAFSALSIISVAVALAFSPPAAAQGWQWPWQNQQSAPVPREPVYRGPSPGQPISPGGSQGYQPPIPQQGANRGTPGAVGGICLQLEQRLAQESNRGSQTKDLLPKLEADIRATDRAAQQGQSQLDRQECFEYFLFSKSLKRTRACVDLNGQVEAAKRRVAELDAQRQQIVSSGGRSYQDDIIRELARNNCGAGYQQEASRRGPFSSIWQDEESTSGGGGQFGNLPFATYKTVCVRLCDGYYFPVSFSTLPTHFDRDAEACQSKCAAPVELYYYQNPGAAVEQAMSFKTKQQYTSLKTAFRYRKEFVQGCSCKSAEYVPSVTGDPQRRADVPPPASFQPRR